MALKDDLQKAEAALADPKVKSYTYEGKKYTLTQLRDELIPRLKKAVETEQRATQAAEAEAARILAGNKFEIGQAQKRVEDAQAALDVDRRAFRKGNLSEAELLATEQRLVLAQQNLASLTGVAPAPVTPIKLPAAGTPEQVGLARTQLRAGERTTVATTPNGEIVTSTPTDQPAPTPTEQPAPATTRPSKKKTKTVAGTGPMGLTDALRAEIRALFPQFASSFDGGTNEQAFVDYFGADVAEIIKNAVANDAYGKIETEAEKAALRRDIEITAYGQRTSDAEQAFDFNPGKQADLIRVKKNEITKQYADLQLDMGQLDTVARDAARKGWTGDDLKFAVYNYAYGAKPSTAMQSELADQIRNAGRAYGYVVSDAELKAALTNTPYNGTMVTQDSILQKAQRAAKGQYGHLADQIDAGLSLEDIFYNYKSYAARTLGIDPSEIDYVNDPKWAEAFGNKDQGQLSLNDWLFKIKSDKRYGYQFTPQAQEEVSSIVSSLEKAFGFRR
jgi:hypothetical protein